ncbi:MAG: helix-turn-helix transcriptional regulator [Mucilaginibacter polytrichastri]|nr:helix-turn-helix transcriptional regulator [Mucilaginibacter polytrichastri]
MKKEQSNHLKFNSISDAHRLFGFAQPQHPLISLISAANNPDGAHIPRGTHVLNFYKIAYKPSVSGRLRYGQQFYDFNDGGLLFAAPNQVIGNGNLESSEQDVCSLYTLLIHPDFFMGHPLAKKIRQYGFFSYSMHETLHLSPGEKATIISIFQMIETELNSRIDDFSQDVVISQIELLLNFANRFYKRQFITRKAINSDLLEKLEALLDDCFSRESALKNGVPTVAYLAGELNLSPSYLSDMLRSLTGQNAQQHIHNKLIEKAKEILSTTSLSVSEVAYSLGFEYSQSFSKLFKSKTRLSPVAFRQQFH